MNNVHAICLEALHAVMNGDSAYQVRRILRWYSREFHTPLHVVEDLPLDDVIQVYFECEFEVLSAKDRLKRAADLIETEEERAARVAEEDAAANADEDFLAALAKKTGPGKQKLQSPAENPVALRGPEPKPPTPDLPEIEMVFDDEGNLPAKEP